MTLHPTNLRPLEEADVKACAALHADAFPHFFLTKLGPRFLSEFYRGFLEDAAAIGIAASAASGEIQGVVVGSTTPTGYFKRLLRRRWFAFAWASLLAVIRHPSIVVRLFRAIGYRGGPAAAADAALLSSICVHPSAHGAGVGRQLLRAWTLTAAQHGASHAVLETDAHGNESTNAFYRSAGWTLRSTHTTPEGRIMNVYEIDLNPMRRGAEDR